VKKKLLSVLRTEEDLFVDITFHDLPATLLKEFAVQVVRPYYSGNLSAAVKDLMQKAVAEQEFVQNHMKP
jgi:hypothetical protein